MCVGIVFASDIFSVCFVLPIMHFVPLGSSLGKCVGTHITINAEGGGVFINVLMSEHNGCKEFKVLSGKSTSNSCQ